MVIQIQACKENNELLFIFNRIFINGSVFAKYWRHEMSSIQVSDNKSSKFDS